MKPNEINIAIAQHLGCEFLPLPQNPNQKTWQRNGCTVEIPDYSGDLYAIHCIEKTFSIKQQGACLVHAVNVVYRDNGPKESAYFATAIQRAEAVLKTLGKWKEAE